MRWPGELAHSRETAFREASKSAAKASNADLPKISALNENFTKAAVKVSHIGISG
jgi:hypothetical protein